VNKKRTPTTPTHNEGAWELVEDPMELF